MVVAVSGGPDSLCLCDAIVALADEAGVRPVVAHLDHGLRGEAARADAEFVRAFALERDVPCIAEAADVASLAREQRVSVEVAARRARYGFLARAAVQAGARHIAVAHHADDQAETVLLRLIRGTGISGLQGMRVQSPHPSAPDLTLIRPLLHVTRADTERYCAERRLAPRQDASNDDPGHTRNRIRHELLPLLERYNLGIRSVLARLADTAAADADIIAYAARTAYGATRIAAASAGVSFDRSAWRALPVGLQRAVLREAVRELRGDFTDLKFAAIEEARDVLNSDAATASIALLAGVRIEVSRHAFLLVTTDKRQQTTDSK